MNEYQEIQVAIKVIEKHFKKHDKVVEQSMAINENVAWGDQLDQGAIVDAIKGINVLIAFEDVLKELKTMASKLEGAWNN